MEQSLSENSRELELIERELQEIEVCTQSRIFIPPSLVCGYSTYVSCVWLFHLFQPGLDNVQTSLQRRNSSLAKIQAKINKLEDEVISSLCKLHTNVCMYF